MPVASSDTRARAFSFVQPADQGLVPAGRVVKNTLFESSIFALNGDGQASPHSHRFLHTPLHDSKQIPCSSLSSGVILSFGTVPRPHRTDLLFPAINDTLAAGGP